MTFEGKSFLVTGASRGIGFDIAQSLVSRGAVVHMTARKKLVLGEACEALGERSFGYCCDATSYEACRNLANDLVCQGLTLDGLVCNVGSGAFPPAHETGSADFYSAMVLNFFSATNTVTAFEQLINYGGSIALISSICGTGVVDGCPPAYATSKAALQSFARYMSKPYGKKGIRINVVAPGNVLFAGSTWERKLSEDADGCERLLQERVALRRFGTPTEISESVLWLLSDAASFVTGETLGVHGGQFG